MQCKCNGEKLNKNEELEIKANSSLRIHFGCMISILHTTLMRVNVNKRIKECKVSARFRSTKNKNKTYRSFQSDVKKE